MRLLEPEVRVRKEASPSGRSGLTWVTVGRKCIGRSCGHHEAPRINPDLRCGFVRRQAYAQSAGDADLQSAPHSFVSPPSNKL